MYIADLIVRGISAYFSAGMLFAVVFLTFGITRIDHQAKGSNLAFRLTILPGVVALWPLLLHRWITGISEPVERNPHRDLTTFRKAA